MNTPRSNVEKTLFGRDTKNTEIKEGAKVEYVDDVRREGVLRRNPHIVFSRRKERGKEGGDTVKSTEDYNYDQGDVRASSQSSDSDEQSVLLQRSDLLSAASSRKIDFVSINKSDGNDVHVQELVGSPSPTPSDPGREDQQLLGKERDQGKGV